MGGGGGESESGPQPIRAVELRATWGPDWSEWTSRGDIPMTPIVIGNALPLDRLKEYRRTRETTMVWMAQPLWIGRVRESGVSREEVSRTTTLALLAYRFVCLVEHSLAATTSTYTTTGTANDVPNARLPLAEHTKQKN